MKYVWKIFKLLVIHVIIHYHHNHVDHYYAELNPVWNFMFYWLQKSFFEMYKAVFVC